MDATLQFIESKWKELFPDRPFSHSFLTDTYSEQFESDERRGTIFTFFSVLIIIIACLGLFGLSSFTVEQRTKEIGIRKVMGASVESIIRLINREFLILILIAMVLGFTGAYFYMKDWLQDFIYPTRMSVWMFVGTGVLTVAVTLLTISYSTIRAGRINPADSLRVE
jgi:putative ABC transport system permease protein